MKNLILASTSTLFGENYLAYLLDELKDFYKNQHTITFIPFARPGGITHDAYTAIVAKAFTTINKSVIGLHNYTSLAKGIEDAEGIFTGGGNTFLLVKQLHEQGLMHLLKDKVEAGTPYLGTSAGSNIAGVNMQNTNDMPIVYPPSFDTLGLVNYNINAHYLDPDPTSKHNGETRATRIKEFHFFNTTPVVGLREGSYIRVQDEKHTLKGPFDARIFKQNEAPFDGKNLHF
ncbi:dipeptidase PepE [Cellulophaga sp. HaHaR_3_176]|uniref:dipeptidase PepE n=1 Tax=Cellulophaga sp. HaHaR_3_176 TaxID=1942464 RepID=UPI001C1FB3C3|nr:dipeptidase PepE [Cellulophaga sp. HaHaR_3_176]QWX84294.1 dipeptidase PepE [Cellulophaga sp. HaHaR_3_176]